MQTAASCGATANVTTDRGLLSPFLLFLNTNNVLLNCYARATEHTLTGSVPVRMGCDRVESSGLWARVASVRRVLPMLGWTVRQAANECGDQLGCRSGQMGLVFVLARLRLKR